jgi:hypothetical protein
MSDSNTAAPPTMPLEREDNMLSVDEVIAFFSSGTEVVAAISIAA